MSRNRNRDYDENRGEDAVRNGDSASDDSVNNDDRHDPSGHPENMPPADAHLDHESGLTGFEKRLNLEIDASLRRLFPQVAASQPHLEELQQKFEANEGNETVTPGAERDGSVSTGSVVAGSVSAGAYPRRGLLVLAASVAVFAVFSWWWFGRNGVTPHFEQTRVADLYQKMVDKGFEPYYICDDDERFQFVFGTRHQVPLSLQEMPEGSEMLGLSYPGGLSRNTTAMLCVVDERPVAVFVDRQSFDSDDVGLTDSADLYVHRDEREGLVFYEVSPFDRPRVTEFMIRPEGVESPQDIINNARNQ